MERLTEYEIIAGHVHAIPKLIDMNSIVAKLADYEDKQEQGLLIELPCKVGDTVYCWRKVVPTQYHSAGIDKWLETDNEIIPARVVNIKILKRGISFKVALKGKCFIQQMHDGEMTTSEDYEYCTYNLSISAIGKTVFSTESEAEEALAKMGGTQ